MSYNGSGTFNINSAGQPVVTGTVITSTAFNALTADLATGLSTALTKDGQTTPTANIPMGTYKITGLGAGTAATDAVRLSQLQNGGTTTYITAAGTDTITGTVTPALTAYATGQQFSFVVAATNTTAVTLNVDGVGAKAVTRTGSVALVAGDMVTGQVVIVEYDGTRFQLINGNSFTNLKTSGILQFADGVVGTPGLRVGNSSTTGLFSSGDNTVRVAVAGVQVALFNSTGMQGVRAATIQVFTASGTYTPATGVRAVEIYIKAGGGSGGGSTNNSRGGGGGEGEEAWKLIPIATVGASQTVTIGAGGVGIALNTNSSGNAGATTSFGSIVTAAGGSGGTVGNSGGAGGGGGNGGSGSDYKMPGDAGQFGADPTSGTVPAAGTGGGKGGGSVATAGVANSGGGGGGGNIVAASGAGGSGIVVVREYY